MIKSEYRKIAFGLIFLMIVSTFFSSTHNLTLASETQPVKAMAATPVEVAGTLPVAAYVHPRILITPDELPALRQRLSSSAIGRRSMLSIRSWLDYVLLDNTRLKPLYQALVAGDENVLKTFPTTYASYLLVAFSLEGFYTMVNDDSAKGAELADALVSCVKILSDDIPNANLKKAIGTELYTLGYCYDFIYNYMTDEQRTIVRNYISAATNGKQLPVSTHAPELNYDNLAPNSTQWALLSLAIEGEEGYDPNVYSQAVLAMNYYFQYGIYPSGASTEDMHYLNFGMSWGSQTMIAMDKRGDSLYDNPNFRKLKDWYVNSIEPFGYKFTTLGDTTNDQGGLLPNYVLLKWLNPDDPVIDFIWRNRVRDDYTGLKTRTDFLMAAMFGLDWKGGENTEKVPVADQWGVDNSSAIPIVTLGDYNPAELNLPKSFIDNNRGLYITRNEWSTDAMVMQFETNSNLVGPTHTHSNSNDFTLTALGQKWAIDRGYQIFEGKNHSTILIDGKGQGFFGAYGKTERLLDSDLGSVFSGNAKNAYDYRYTFKGRMSSDENLGYAWEFEPKSIRPESDVNSTFRALENPVQKAFRSAAMVRGTNSYVLILDDIQKDDNEHLYEWLMQVPNELEAKSIVGGDMILGLDDEVTGTPRMLIRSLESKTTSDPTLRDTYTPLRLETFEVKNSDKTGSYKNNKIGMGKRVVLSSRSVSPSFKTLLFPHSQGATMPTTTLSGSMLKIEWPGQKDEYTFQDLEDGSTAFGMIRNGGESFLTVGLTQYNPNSTISMVAEKAGANVAFEANELTINGSGWKKLTINAPDVLRVTINDTEGEIEHTTTGVIITETVATPMKHK